MSSHSFIPSKKWPEAVSEALSCITELPELGDIDEPVFLFGPPSHGRLPFRIRVKGQTTPLCVLGDEYPFLDELRGWMERCLMYDCLGTFHPEIATLDTPDGVCYLLMVHAGWEKTRFLDVSSISELIIILSDCSKPTFRCFCRTRDTIRDLYAAILGSIREYGSLFDDSAQWYDTESFSLLETKSCSVRMEENIESQTIEIKTGYNEKNRH